MGNDKKLTGWDRLESDKQERSKVKNNAFPTYIRKSKPQQKNWKSMMQDRYTRFKHVIFASFSAIIIGVLLGVTLLTLLPNLNGEEVTIAEQQEVSSERNEKKETSTVENSSAEIEEMKGIVLQAGVFQKKESAEELIFTIEQLGFPAFLWEQEGQYLLFCGVTETKERANQLAAELEESGIEIYVKDWSTREFSMNLTEEENHWINDIQQLWRESLQKHEQKETLHLATWKRLSESRLLDESPLSSIQNFISQEIPQESSEMSFDQEQMLLLKTWKKIAEIITE